jgi:hypothetical protein
MSKPKHYKKDRADMLKNLCKATRFHYDSHDCNSNGKSILQEGWLASLKGFKVSLAGLFQHICHVNNSNLMQLVSKLT